jgi:hypothetical protein
MGSVGAARPRRASRAQWGVALAAVMLVAAAFWLRPGLSDVFGKQYEYEEDLTIALDGSASLTVNASIAALAALRGLPLDPASATVDRDRVRALYESPVTRVRSVPRPWRRNGRQFVQINLEIPDIRRLHEAAPFSWSRYELVPRTSEHLFRQTVGLSALRPGTLRNVGWDGRELVAFRVHFPSRIVEHNARDLEKDEPTGVLRGNILAWEQHLSDRLDGREVRIEVRLESRSILYRTLWLFAGAFLAAVLTLGALIWWTVRKGRAGESGSGGVSERRSQ